MVSAGSQVVKTSMKRERGHGQLRVRITQERGVARTGLGGGFLCLVTSVCQQSQSRAGLTGGGGRKDKVLKKSGTGRMCLIVGTGGGTEYLVGGG